ncbi:TIGR04283 family arsenosugar biosynthesis glycosyltransferase [Candidatus Omnitrophota bacterium]
MISVIIPFYNEEKIFSANSDFFQGLSRKAELIFVDGGSTDSGVDIAKNYSRVVQAKKGRATQMNHGARLAQNDILLFLHADNFIDIDVLASIEDRLLNDDFIGGCLTQRIDKEGIIYRFIEEQGNRRARRKGVFYGDQGVFVKKDIFLKMGGYPDVPIMEDVLFSKKLREVGRVIVLDDKIIVSPRRWEKNGVAKTVALYNLIMILFYLKVPLHKIKRLYNDLR